MEQISHEMMLAVQLAAQRKNTPEAKETAKEETSFRDLMEKQRPTEKPEKAEVTDEPREEAPVEGAALLMPAMPLPADDPELQEQMVLAALTVMQTPVVPMEQTVVPVQAPVAPEMAAAQMEQAVAVEMAEMEAPQPEMAVQGSQTMGEALQGEPALQTDTAQTQSPMDAAGKGGEKGMAESRSEADASHMEWEDGAEIQVFREVREIPVKVGEAPVVEKAQTALPVEQQVGEKLAQALEHGESRVVIQLQPENLGQVNVELTWDQDGILHVVLHAENSQTRGLLERDSLGLQSLLSRTTQQEVQVEVPRQQEAQQQNFDEGRQNGRHQEQHQQRDQGRDSQDFLQQLRLGLIPMEGEAS